MRGWLDTRPGDQPPILSRNDYLAETRFRLENLLREARHQNGRPAGTTPAVCVLDHVADIAKNLAATGHARHDEAWSCYCTMLYVDMRCRCAVAVALCAASCELSSIPVTVNAEATRRLTGHERQS